MSPANEPKDLGPFEARLAELLPRATDVDRDEVLFQAGREVARSESRRTLRKWQAACGVLVCLAIMPWVRLADTSHPGNGLNASSDPPIETEDAAPSPTPAPVDSRPVLVKGDPSKIVPQTTEPKNSSQQVATNQDQPSNPWYQLFPSFGAADPSLALQRRLSIGSSREGKLSLSNLAPQIGGLPSGSEPPLTTMRHDWSPD